MRALKTNSFIILFSISFLFVMLTSACAQSDKKNTSSDKATNSEIEAPKITLQAAILTGNISAVKQHIAAGTDINAIDQMSGSTPLMTAITFDKTAIAKVLIDAKADLTLTNNEGATALHVAAFFCRVEIVQQLVDAKADKSIRNKFGATARETVIAPFDGMKPVYEMVSQQLKPLGLNLDLAELEKKRPVVAVILQ